MTTCPVCRVSGLLSCRWCKFFPEERAEQVPPEAHAPESPTMPLHRIEPTMPVASTPPPPLPDRPAPVLRPHVPWVEPRRKARSHHAPYVPPNETLAPPVANSEAEWNREQGRCRHCASGTVNRPRGLCWSCYYLPGVRELYPPMAKCGCRGLGQGFAPGVLPEYPTDALPGSPEKLAVMEARAAARQILHHPADARFPEDPRVSAFLMSLAC